MPTAASPAIPPRFAIRGAGRWLSFSLHTLFRGGHRPTAPQHGSKRQLRGMNAQTLCCSFADVLTRGGCTARAGAVSSSLTTLRGYGFSFAREDAAADAAHWPELVQGGGVSCA